MLYNAYCKLYAATVKCNTIMYNPQCTIIMTTNRNRTGLLILLIGLCTTINFSCKREGPGGKARVYGVVTHDGVAIPGAKVYIKYGSGTSPGTNVAAYDREYPCDVNGNYAIGSLVQGSYFLYVVGYDQNNLGITEQVTGGTALVLGRKDNKQQDIALSK